MIPLTAEAIAEALGARLVPPRSGEKRPPALAHATSADNTPSDVSLRDCREDEAVLITGSAQTDSREIAPGQIFVARRGAHTDGHHFVTQAVDRGAALLIVERETDDRVPQVIVDDATLALGRLAQAVVARAKSNGTLRVVGITGSNGKTTTKNLLASMASRLGATVANAQSLNNEVGAPLTMLRVDEHTQTLVVEMGASAEGEIARLTEMASPDIAVVLTVGLAHIGGFGDLETTFRAKSELLRELPAQAVAVLNRDDPQIVRMAQLTRARVRWFGWHAEAEVRASEVVGDASGTSFVIHADGQQLPVRFRVLGEHHVGNALAAAAVGLELGLSLEQVVASLEAETLAAPGRMQVMRGRDGITVINDAYNASPDSMRAALGTLARAVKPGGRAVAVLGEMAELGEYSAEQHHRLGTQVVRLGIDQLVVVGAGARSLYLSSIAEGSWNGESVWVAQPDEAFEYLMRTLRPNDTVLVKSSHAAGLQALGDRLAVALDVQHTTPGDGPSLLRMMGEHA